MKAAKRPSSVSLLKHGTLARRCAFDSSAILLLFLALSSVIFGKYGHLEEHYFLRKANDINLFDLVEPWLSSIEFCPWTHVRHVITVTHGKDYFATRSIYYYSNSTSSFHQMRLLIRSDISLNPGPDKCHHCSKGIARKHRALDCSDCEKRYHVKCSGANPK